jgi:hypothetical protein
MRSYEALNGLAEIVLEESYVLGVAGQPGELTFEVDFALTQEHSAYAPPPPSETECFRRDTLHFVGVERLLSEGQGGPRVRSTRPESPTSVISTRSNGETGGTSSTVIGAESKRLPVP